MERGEGEGGAPQSEKGRTTEKRVEKEDWAREIWGLHLLQHPVQSSSRGWSREPVQSHIACADPLGLKE